MNEATGLFIFLVGVLLVIHGTYFFVIKRIGRLDMLSSGIAFGGGIILWFLVFTLVYGAGRTIHVDLPLANIEITGKDIFANAHLYLKEILNIADADHSANLMASVGAPAFAEEFGKLFFLFLTYLILTKLGTRRGIENIGTSAASMAMVALGFSLAENIQYTYVLIDHPGVFIKTAMRGVLLPPVHMSFALYAGYAFGKAIYLRWDMIDNKKLSRLRALFRDDAPIWKQHALKLGIVTGGLACATLLHVIYNYLMKMELTAIAMLFSLCIIFVFFFLLARFEMGHAYQDIRDRIQKEKRIKKLRNGRKKLFG